MHIFAWHQSAVLEAWLEVHGLLGESYVICELLTARVRMQTYRDRANFAAMHVALIVSGHAHCDFVVNACGKQQKEIS